jgi:hypothetical protein
VHDLDYIRENDRKRRKKEIRTFNLADELIVHTPAMADELKKQGVRVPLKILILFDYLTSINDVYKEPDIHSVVFAGNIRKSDFVELLINNDIWNIKTFMYGVNNLEYPENSNFHYKGIFTSEDISQIKGAWGLVWDGDSIETCSSNKGLYLRYNSSHKISLYLVAEKPVIVWSQSSLRYFVEEQGIGIVVDSLLDIPELLSGITETHYREYVENVKKISEKLRAGAFLSSCLQS